MTNPKGWATTTVLNVARNLGTKITDLNGRVTTLAYDSLGRLTSVWLPNRTTAQTASYKFTYTVSATAPSSVKTETLREVSTYHVSYEIYDALLRLRQTQATPPDGGTGRVIIDTKYDTHGWTRLTSAAYYNSAEPSATLFAAVDSQVPQQTLTGYDGMGRPTSVGTYHLANLQWATTTAYPGLDRTDTTPPADSTPTTSITDGRGQQTQLWQYHGSAPSGAHDVTAYRYDALGRAVGQTDSAGNIWSTGYDQLGNIVTADDPDTGVTTWSYNDASELTSTTDARGQSIAYLYDTLGRRIEQRDGSPTGPKLAAWSYDTATGGRGQPASATAYNAAGAVTYTNVVAGYTTLYKPTGATVTIPAGTVGNPAAITYTTSNTYTPATQLLYSSRIETTGAGGLLPTETVGYSYNVNGLPVASGGLSTYVSWVNYTHLGQPTRATMGVVPNQVVQTYSYDPFTRLAGYTVDRQNGLSSVSDVSYTRNPAGHVTSITDVQGGGSTTTTDRQCFTYDHLSRLTTAWTDTGGVSTAPSPMIPGIGGCTNATPAAGSLGGPQPYWQSYSYDPTGNRLTRTDHNTAGNPALDITTTHTYNPPGDPDQSPHAVRTVTTGAGPTAAYTYDPAGNPLTITNGTSSQDQTLTWSKTGELATLTIGPPGPPPSRCPTSTTPTAP